MKKRLICLLLTLAMLAGLVPTVALAATDPASVKLYIAPNAAIGMNGRSDIALHENAGTVYLPGTADAKKCTLCWDAADVTVNGQGSGTVAIPAPGECADYTIATDGKSLRVTLKTLQGSAGIAALFLNIDESLGTIADMNRDRLKEATCYGTLNLDGEEIPMSIKGRGNSTWTNFDKKPYNLTTYTDTTYIEKRNTRFIGDVKTKKWSIIANAKDSTLLRNHLALELANHLGIGLPTRFVDVWMNGEYRGNYLMTPKNDYQSPKTGYMVEIDNTSDQQDPQFTVRGFDGSRAPTFTVKDNGVGATTEEIKAYVQKAATAILDAASDDYLNYIDVESWAKMYLLNELYKTTDVVSGSIFFTRASLNDQDKLVAGPVWDFDVALGRAWAKSVTTVENEAQVSGGKWYIDSIQTKAWYRALGQHKEIMERVYELYNEYKEYFDAVPDFVRERDAFVKASADMNFDRWDVNRDKDHNPFTCTEAVTYGAAPYSVTYIAASTREDYVENLLTYVTVRTSFLSDRLTVEAPAGTVEGSTTVRLGDTATLRASLSRGDDPTYQWQTSADGEAWENLGTEATLRVTATAEQNGKYFRCLVRSNGALIDDVKYVAKVRAGARAVLGPVKLRISGGDCAHDYQAKVTAPTCIDSGFTTYTCTLCGDSYQADEVPALGHDIVGGRCSRCGTVPFTAQFQCDAHCTVTVFETQAADSPFEENAATAYARDSATGAVDTSGNGQINFTVVPAQGYEVASVVAEPLHYKNLKLPADTGVKNGYRITKITGDFTVTVTTRMVEAPATPFTATFDCDPHCSVTVYDTQTLENGHETATSAVARDSVTGEVDTSGNGQINFVAVADEGYEIDSVTATPANYKNLKTPVDTGVENGYRITKITGDFTVTVTTRKAECRHEYSAVALAPTCTAPGYTTYTCAKCGDSYQGDKVAALGHAYKATVTAPTCLDSGFTTYTCTRCQDSYQADKVAALGHAYKATVTAPTCLDSGFTTYTCTRCQDSYQADEVAATGHRWDGGSITTAPTEEAAGVKTFTCTACGETRAEPIAPLPHTHKYTAVVTAPTCLAPGYTTYTCTKCGDTYQGDEVAALGHAYKAVVTAPTCLDPGFTTYTCAKCGDTYQGDEVAALGHAYKATVTAPTCLAPGYTTYTCVCGDSYTDATVPALGHDFAAGACTRCGAEDPDYDPLAGFTDLKNIGWAREGIAYCVKRGLMKGMSTTRFDPAGYVTRAQLVTILYRIEGEPPVEYQGTFQDVAAGKWYTAAIEWAAARGIVKGIGHERFDPDGKITREQIAAILYRRQGSPAVDGDLLAYPDGASVSAYAVEALCWATQQQLIHGIAANGITRLAPSELATRAQIAAIIMRYLKD